MDKQEIETILSEIQYKPNFKFVVGEDYIQLQETTTCNRSGEPYLSKGRKWKWSQFMTKSEIVTTCLKACLQYEEHEARENFKYKDVSIFDPHFDCDALVKLRKSNEWCEVREEH